MLKNVKFYLDNTGSDIFGMISLVIFFLFFMGLLWYVYKMNNDTINEIKNIPIQEDENEG